MVGAGGGSSSRTVHKAGKVFSFYSFFHIFVLAPRFLLTLSLHSWPPFPDFQIIVTCNKTTLTGESWFHTCTPWGFEPGYLIMGSEQVVHWTSKTWWEWSEIAGSPLGSPQQPTLLVVKLEGGPAASVKSGQKSCVIKSIKSAYTLSARSVVKHPLKEDEASD